MTNPQSLYPARISTICVKLRLRAVDPVHQQIQLVLHKSLHILDQLRQLCPHRLGRLARPSHLVNPVYPGQPTICVGRRRRVRRIFVSQTGPHRTTPAFQRRAALFWADTKTPPQLRQVLTKKSCGLNKCPFPQKEACECPGHSQAYRPDYLENYLSAPASLKVQA